MGIVKTVAVAAMATALAAPALAQNARPAVTGSSATHAAPAHHEMQGTLLSISAQGRSESRPDLATVSLGVVTEGATAAAALSANAQRMNGLIAALRRAGVAERDIQTTNVSVNPQYVYQENQAPRISGYQATNTVNARVRNLDNLGRVIDASVNAGGNTVNGVSFSHQDPDAQADAARRDAMTEARRIAALYAQAAGLSVHRIISISEGAAYSPPFPMPMMARMEAMAAPAPTPVAPGEIETTASVSVMFELR